MKEICLLIVVPGYVLKMSELSNTSFLFAFPLITDATHINVTDITTQAPVDEVTSSLRAQLDLTRFIVLKIIMPIVIAFGIVGNVMNVCVLTQRWMRSSTNRYLTSLAVCDVLYLCFVLTLILDRLNSSLTTNRAFLIYKYHVGYPFANLWSNTGVWVTLTFTIERYINVCYPIHGKRWCTPTRAKFVICFVFFAAAMFTFPCFFQYKIIEKRDQGNETVHTRDDTDFGAHPINTVGYTWLSQTLFTFLPIVLLSVFNCMLIRTVTKASKRRSEMSCVQASLVSNHEGSSRLSRQQREQQKITIMLIAVVVVFLACQLPQAIANIYAQSQAEMSQPTRLRLLIINNICNLLVAINASINFVLYSSLSRKFRRTFVYIFCRNLRRNQPPVRFIFSEVLSNHPDTTMTRGSPYTRSPIALRHAPSNISINAQTTPFLSPAHSMRSLHMISNSHTIAAESGNKHQMKDLLQVKGGSGR